MDDSLLEAPRYREDGSTSSYADMKTAARNGVSSNIGEALNGLEIGLEAALEGDATTKEAIEAGVQAAKEIFTDLEGSSKEILVKSNIIDVKHMAKIQDYDNNGLLNDVIRMMEPASTNTSTSKPSLQATFFERLDHDIPRFRSWTKAAWQVRNFLGRFIGPML